LQEREGRAATLEENFKKAAESKKKRGRQVELVI
jgi:hypothetical protein